MENREDTVLECPYCMALVDVSEVKDDYELVRCWKCGKFSEVHKGLLLASDEEE